MLGLARTFGKTRRTAMFFIRINIRDKIDLYPYVYAYEEHGGTARFAECTGKPEHQVIKTIVLSG